MALDEVKSSLRGFLRNYSNFIDAWIIAGNLELSTDKFRSEGAVV